MAPHNFVVAVVLRRPPRPARRARALPGLRQHDLLLLRAPLLERAVLRHPGLPGPRARARTAAARRGPGPRGAARGPPSPAPAPLSLQRAERRLDARRGRPPGGSEPDARAPFRFPARHARPQGRGRGAASATRSRSRGSISRSRRSASGIALRVEVDVDPEARDRPGASDDPPAARRKRRAARRRAARRGRRDRRSSPPARTGCLRLGVHDDGPGPAAPRRWRPGDSDAPGLGLANTRQRLEELYGERAELTLGESAAGGLAVSLRLPFRERRRRRDAHPVRVVADDEPLGRRGIVARLAPFRPRPRRRRVRRRPGDRGRRDATLPGHPLSRRPDAGPRRIRRRRGAAEERPGRTSSSSRPTTGTPSRRSACAPSTISSSRSTTSVSPRLSSEPSRPPAGGVRPGAADGGLPSAVRSRGRVTLVPAGRGRLDRGPGRLRLPPRGPAGLSSSARRWRPSSGDSTPGSSGSTARRSSTWSGSRAAIPRERRLPGDSSKGGGRAAPVPDAPRGRRAADRALDPLPPQRRSPRLGPGRCFEISES